jgi:hypothetical protein
MTNLTKIQNELKAPKNQFNAFGKYKYRNCEDILEAVKPLLDKHNCELTISDAIHEVNGFIYVEATASLIFNSASGAKQFFEVKASAGIDPNRKGMDIAQSFGASSSYARKYALNGLFLIDDTKDADTVEAPKEPTLKIITDEQMISLCNRYNAGEKDVFIKAKAHLTFRQIDLQTIKSLENVIPN